MFLERIGRHAGRSRGLQLCGILLAFVLIGCRGQAPPQTGTVAAPTATLAVTTVPTAFATVLPRVETTGTPTFGTTPAATLTRAVTLAGPTGTATSAAAAVVPTVCREKQGQVAASTFHSQTLGRAAVYQVYLPPCYSRDETRLYPVLYLLHGAHADDTQWLDLEAAADADALILKHAVAPFVIVMPDGDYRSGENYAAFVQMDLMPEIERTTRVERTSNGRAIGGLSMGGYWALRLALAHPELFAAVGGHSPATDSTLLANAAQGWQKLRIYLDVGQDDSLASGVMSFATGLKARGAVPEVHLYAGNHTRPYWRSHTMEYLEFYARGW